MTKKDAWQGLSKKTSVFSFGDVVSIGQAKAIGEAIEQVNG